MGGPIYGWITRGGGGADLVEVLELGGKVVPDHLHGFEWRLVEVGRLAVHHLYHHDAQRPDVHLQAGRTAVRNRK